MNFADTNWLEAVYIEPEPEDKEACRRRQIVERFMRKHGGELVLSQIVLLEARNVFSRVTGESTPEEWKALEQDFDSRLYVDPMNWDILRRECNALFAHYSSRVNVGTFDAALVASAKLAGGTRFLSFDKTACALAKAVGLDPYPPLDAGGHGLLRRLKRA